MSFSEGSSSSTSTPTFQETPENSIIDQISATAAGLAGQMVNWANGVFANTSRITDQAVGNFFQVSRQMAGLSDNLTGQYNNLFAPENAQLVADANSYASPARMAVDMGQAGATQAQAGDQALKNSEEALRSYGINPSDGRYAALDKAMAVQNAANIAGAENMQRNADIDRGQRLRSEAVNIGAQLPAAISNVNNTALQANTGASNASLANANTGANLQRIPNDFLRTAMDVKLPPTGQNSQSQSRQTASGPAPQPRQGSGSGSGSGAGGSGSGGGSSGPAWMPQHTGYTGDHTGYAARGGAQPGSKVIPIPPQEGTGPTEGEGTSWPLDFEDTGQATNWDGDIQTSGQPYDFGPYTGGGGFDEPSDAGGFNGGGWGGDSYSGGGDYGQSAYSGVSDPGSDYYAGDYTQPSSDYDMGGAYAGGGAIPQTMSPSGGAQVDDIPAQGPSGQPLQMNANEFVIPQDVAQWKGQEFFQNLIAKSRKMRVTAPAHPKPMMR